MDKPVDTGPISNPVDRRMSAASTASSGSAAGMPSSPTSPTSRKKSFSSLENQKRSADSLPHRQSMMDQRPAPGLIGRWWNSYVYGTK